MYAEIITAARKTNHMDFKFDIKQKAKQIQNSGLSVKNRREGAMALMLKT